MVFLTFILQTRIRGAVGRGSVGGEREKSLKERSDVCCGLRGGLVAIGTCLDLGEDCWTLERSRFRAMRGEHTLQTVDCPLFELLERDLCRRRCVVQVQTVRIILLLVGRCSELPLLVIDCCPAFWVDSMSVLSDHGVWYAISCRECPS